MELSAKSGHKIESIFTQISWMILNRIDKGEIEPQKASISIRLGSLETERNANQSSSRPESRFESNLSWD
jgi:hypothetical protein